MRKKRAQRLRQGCTSGLTRRGYLRYDGDMEKIDLTKFCTAPERIGKQWMLITAGTPEKFNCMTASWGGVGFLWNRPVAFIFVRPNRYTREFIDREEALTLTFMPESARQDLVFCGRNSGRDTDKMAATGLQPVTTESGLVTFKDAEYTLECRKMFRAPLPQEGFMDWAEVSPAYYAEDNPLHLLYICEITAVLAAE